MRRLKTLGVLLSCAVMATVTLAGCGGREDEETTAEIAEADEPSESPPDEPDDPEEADTPEVPPEPEPQAAERVTYTLPDGRAPSLPQLRLHRAHSRGASWDEIRHDDPVVQRRMNALLTAIGYAEGSLVSDNGEAVDDDYGGCHIRHATARVVSVLCRPMDRHRSGDLIFARGVSAYHFVIDGQEVRPFDLSAILKDGVGFPDLIDRPHCVSRARYVGGEPGDVREAPARCNQLMGEARGVLVEDGIDLLLGHELVVSRPWSTIREQLAPTGPLAWIFERVDREPPPSAEDSAGWAVGPALPEAELAAGFSALPAEVAADVRVASLGAEVAQLVVPRALGWPRAHAIAEALHVTPRRVASGELRRLVRARTTESAVLRASEHGAELRRVPAHTFVTALAPEEGFGEAAVHVVASANRGGWLPPAHLAPVEGCEPPVAPFLEGLDEEAAATFTLSSIRLRDEGGEVDAALFAARSGDRVVTRIQALDEACQPTGERRLDVTSRGYLFDLRTTTTEASGGLTLVVLGVNRGAARAYLAYRPGSSAPVLDLTLDAEDSEVTEVWGRLPPVELAATVDDAFAPFRLQYTGSFVWNGRRLVRSGEAE